MTNPKNCVPDDLFRLLLDCYMQADPHPWTDEQDKRLTNYLNSNAVARGFDSWVVAYHEFKVN